MFTLALAIILSAPPTTPPEKPAQRPWIGGKWTGDDEDKGKEFPKGAFMYTPKAEHEAWIKACHEWLTARKPSVKFDAYGIPAALASMELKPDPLDAVLTAAAALKTYGGVGTIKAIQGMNGLYLEINLRNVDFEGMSDGLAMKIPIRVTGTVGKLTGIVEGNRGTFVGTDVQARGATIRRLDLSVDYATGLYTATADTNFGRQTIRGRLREAK